MKTFVYKAKTNEADDTQGRLMAQTRQEALSELTAKGLVVINIEELSEGGSKEVKRESWRKMFGVNLKELLNFTKRMVILLRSGIPLLRALDIMVSQTEDTYFRQVLEDLADQVKSGKALSESMAGYPKVFSSFYTAMVRSGEKTGVLDGTMLTLSDYYTRQRQLASKVRGALAYPGLVMGVGLLTLVFIFTNVMPKILPVLETLDTEFPLPTRVLIGMTEFLKDTWLWIFLGIFIVGAIFARALKNPLFREHLSAIKLKLPIFGEVILKAELARFTRALEISLRSGIPIVKAIGIAMPIIKEKAILNSMKDCATVLERGDTLEESLRLCGVFDDFVLNIVHVGEESGDLTGTLSEIADEFEEQAKTKVDVMVNLLEPLIILFVALVIGFIVMAVLLPIFNLDFMGT